jgi:hypothetical protein
MGASEFHESSDHEDCDHEDCDSQECDTCSDVIISSSFIGINRQILHLKNFVVVQDIIINNTDIHPNVSEVSPYSLIDDLSGDIISPRDISTDTDLSENFDAFSMPDNLPDIASYFGYSSNCNSPRTISILNKLPTSLDLSNDREFSPRICITPRLSNDQENSPRISITPRLSNDQENSPRISITPRSSNHISDSKQNTHGSNDSTYIEDHTSLRTLSVATRLPNFIDSSYFVQSESPRILPIFDESSNLTPRIRTKQFST